MRPFSRIVPLQRHVMVICSVHLILIVPIVLILNLLLIGHHCLVFYRTRYSAVYFRLDFLLDAWPVMYWFRLYGYNLLDIILNNWMSGVQCSLRLSLFSLILSVVYSGHSWY